MKCFVIYKVPIRCAEMIAVALAFFLDESRGTVEFASIYPRGLAGLV